MSLFSANLQPETCIFTENNFFLRVILKDFAKIKQCKFKETPIMCKMAR